MLQCTISIKTGKKTGTHDSYYARTVFLNKHTNRCNVSAMGDRFYDFFLRAVTITTLLYHIAEKLAPKNLLQTIKNAK